ncbi:MAG: hypothetical protein H7Z74_06140 [Anaerolineae bacterium]|nr:hypothetical protein [Gemmatimonadaceae bacterium]
MIVTLALVLSLQSQPSRDRWFGPDKVKHFFIAAFLQSVSYSALRAANTRHGLSMAGATATTTVFSIGKEFSDRRKYGEFSFRDLVYDAGGAAAASTLLVRTER